MTGLSVVLMLLSGCAKVSSYKTDLTAMITNLRSSIEPVWTLVWASTFLIGIGLIVFAMFKFKRLGEMQGMMSMEHTIKEPLVPMLVGVALVFAVSMLDATMNTFFAYGATDALNAYPVDNPLDWSTDLMETLTLLARVIGMIVFVRGWLLLTRMGQMHPQPGTLSKGLIHIVGGVMAINITGVITILANTVGL